MQLPSVLPCWQGGLQWGWEPQVHQGPPTVMQCTCCCWPAVPGQAAGKCSGCLIALGNGRTKVVQAAHWWPAEEVLCMNPWAEGGFPLADSHAGHASLPGSSRSYWNYWSCSEM